MDRLTEINAFVKVAQTGSFAEAARQLHVSSTIVSRHIRELEEWLGVRLLNRTTRHVALTEIGHVVNQDCLEILDKFQSLEETADAWRGTLRGALRVSAPLMFGSTVLAAKLPEFLALYPHISIELNLTDRQMDLVEDGLDLAIRLGHLPDSSALMRTLCRLNSGLYASPAYLALHGRPAKIEDLTQHECILYSFLGNELTVTDQTGMAHLLKPAGRLRTNSVAVAMTAMIQGQGIGLIPHYLASDSLKAGTLEKLLPAFALPNIDVHALYHPGRHQAAKLRVFIDFLASSLTSSLASFA